VRASFAQLLADASARGGAVGAFTAYNLEIAAGVLRAAEEREAGVVVLLGPGSFRARSGRLLAAALVALADQAAVPACVQLDHVDDLAAMEDALALGVGAVMADGSALPGEANAELVRAAVGLAGAAGAHVEGGPGRSKERRDRAAAVVAGALTDPDEAAGFVDRTGAACLAVSIGNVHGRYVGPPRLDWERLAAVRERVDVPLSLHGASGLPDEDVRRAIALGVAKINVNTELRDAYLAATARELGRAAEGADVLGLNEAQADAVAAVAAAKLSVCDPPG
jgi:ketose-bisphosphate aldolase